MSGLRYIGFRYIVLEYTGIKHTLKFAQGPYGAFIIVSTNDSLALKYFNHHFSCCLNIVIHIAITLLQGGLHFMVGFFLLWILRCTLFHNSQNNLGVCLIPAYSSTIYLNPVYLRPDIKVKVCSRFLIHDNSATAIFVPGNNHFCSSHSNLFK